MNRVDVAIIGGSLAGAACVRELNRLGVEAVALERDEFPREKVCGGFLSPGAVEVLDQLGVLGAVRRAGAVAVKRVRIRMPGKEVEFELPRPALGISRKALDAVMAERCDVRHTTVRGVRRLSDGFHVALVDGGDGGDGDLLAKVVIDAAGKLSRFTRRASAEQFGVQFYTPEAPGDVLDFWFFGDGYGGVGSVEGGRANSCFLINKDALPRYLGKPGCRVTGPIAYDAHPSEFLAIGDAAGMIDPFCGEGMRHALDTGRIAAAATAQGFRAGWSYEEMRRAYEAERLKRWAGKRRLARVVRRMLRYPRVASLGPPEWLMRQFWL